MDETSSMADDIATAMSPEAPAAEPAAPVDATAPPEAATIAPADTSASPSTEKPPGPIPFDVHKTALENARTKAREEAVTEWKQKYGWAEQIDQQSHREAMQWFARYQGDPIAFTQGLVAELQAHPVHGQALRSLAARALASGRGQPAVEEEPQPDLPIQLEDGRVLSLYSPQQQAKLEQWRDQRLLTQVRQEYAPALQAAKKLEQAEELHQQTVQANTFAKGFYSELQQLPGFKEHEAEIRTRLSQKTLQSDHPAAVEAAVMRLYTEIVVPKLQATERQSVLNQQHLKAEVNTASPTSGGAGTPTSYADLSWAEAFQHELAAKR